MTRTTGSPGADDRDDPSPEEGAALIESQATPLAAGLAGSTLGPHGRAPLRRPRRSPPARVRRVAAAVWMARPPGPAVARRLRAVRASHRPAGAERRLERRS